MGEMPHPDQQMTQRKRILLCWDLMEGSDVQGLGKTIELTMYVVCMGVTCCSACIHAEMEHWDLGQKPLKI